MTCPLGVCGPLEVTVGHRIITQLLSRSQRARRIGSSCAGPRVRVGDSGPDWEHSTLSPLDGILVTMTATMLLELPRLIWHFLPRGVRLCQAVLGSLAPGVARFLPPSFWLRTSPRAIRMGTRVKRQGVLPLVLSLSGCTLRLGGLFSMGVVLQLTV